ncbi:MAG: tetraacyldisaccharide 4'-kinase [Bacteroidia bacterium]|nr:tetraacyldisaccharide 4'-kinase [Bacteroidia bacterium]
MEILKWLLLPLALLYGGIMAVRNFLWSSGLRQPARAGLPVISVGNISAGGTGKTPMAELILRKLIALGYQPAYLSRGYGRQTRGFFLVDPAQFGASAQFGDEALQVAAKFPGLPVAVCEDRILGAKILQEKTACSVLVLDDAFQHRRIHRDLDLLMIDGSRPPHRDFLLPVGRLREPLSGLKRASMLLINKAFILAEREALSRRYARYKTGFLLPRPVGLRPFDAKLPAPGLSDLREKGVFAFSGVGNNASFHAVIEANGGIIREKMEFPDHHSFTNTDLDKILDKFERAKAAFGQDLWLICTEKDYFRIREKVSGKWLTSAYWLQIELSWETGEKEFDALLHKTLNLKHE